MTGLEFMPLLALFALAAFGLLRTRPDVEVRPALCPEPTHPSTYADGIGATADLLWADQGGTHVEERDR